jgi:hypothetical protein
MGKWGNGSKTDRSFCWASSKLPAKNGGSSKYERKIMTRLITRKEVGGLEGGDQTFLKSGRGLNG